MDNMNYLHQHFSKYMKKKYVKSFFLSPTNKNEISRIIFSFNPNKSTSPNGIPTKILKLLKEEISSDLSDIYNISFSMAV